MPISYAVVDGSNIATEGRSMPSLAQLDDAVRQFQDEFPELEVIVVVDATFGHRIDAAERSVYDDAVAHGEIVSPPAGAIGRGDAFLLRVAERVGAQVLSNDSFQEFHGEHSWLFDEGRLIGGKPVAGIGWIFTPRSPVRGPKSRAATGTARRTRATSTPEMPESWEPPTGAPQVGDRRTRRTAPHSAAAVQAVASAVAEVEAATRDDMAEPVTLGDAPQDPGHAPREAATRPSRAAKALGAIKAMAAPRARRGRAGSAAGQSDTPPDPEHPTAAAKKAAAAKPAASGPGGTVVRPAKKAAATVGPTTKKASAAKTPGSGGKQPAATKAASTRPTKAPVAKKEVAKKEVAKRAPARKVTSSKETATVPDAPPPASRGRKSTEPVNDPLTFLTFVTEHPVGSSVEGTVAAFVSHGAMVDVGGMRCYLPLRGLGHPPPQKAREVLDRGERRWFTIVALDPPRRGAELALESAAPSL